MNVRGTLSSCISKGMLDKVSNVTIEFITICSNIYEYHFVVSGAISLGHPSHILPSLQILLLLSL